jgi:membrane associated rhomboid family serine protease
MFPIRDTIRSRSFPIINWILIIVNVLVFFYEWSLTPEQLQNLISNFALIPSAIDISHPLTFYRFITHMFMHAGWFHVLSNVWVLYIFGDNVEDRLGGVRYLVFYLVGGVIAGVLQATLGGSPSVPSLGASGAIAAVMGAYFLFFPSAKVITLIPILIFPWFVELPALVFLGFWFVSQIFSGVLALATAGGVQAGGVAWWAHIGGFIYGLALARVFQLRNKPPSWHPDEYYPW